MGSAKKEAARKERQGKTGDGMGNVKTKGENFYRNAKKVKTLNMFNEGKPQRNASGKITKTASHQSRDKPSARIEPNRKWFGNTRVIAQGSLTQFREAIAAKSNDPYSYLLKQNKLPMSLIRDGDVETKNGLKQHQAKIAVETSPFSDTFGPKSRRKRVKLDVGSLEDFAGKSDKMHNDYIDQKEQAKMLSGKGETDAEASEAVVEDDGNIAAAREPIFSKGQSKRIWNELYKVVDSSDVLIQVLDARDPEGTRCHHIEKYIKTEAPHKHILLVLNKCDLIPTKVAARLVRTLSPQYPTLAFHSSITNSFGKGSLLQLLRQFSTLHAHRKQLSVGFIGYPNVGKSSIINTLRKKKVCKTGPVPGETKVWQYITLMKRIYLIDCPGVVPPSLGDTDAEILLRGSVRVESVENPAQYVAAALERCQKRHVERTYDIRGWETAEELLDKLARKSGKLLKGGEVDTNTVAKSLLQDFLRGKIPWFVPPDGFEGVADPQSLKSSGELDTETGGKGTVGDMTRLNKVAVIDMRKRKRDDANAHGTSDGESEADGIDGIGGSGTELDESADEDDVSADDSDAQFSASDSDDSTGFKTSQMASDEGDHKP